MKSLNVLIALFFAMAVITPIAAESDAAVSYAEGSGFIIISGGVRNSYDIAADDVLGLPLNAGDTILTDDGSFVEVQMLTGDGGVIKVAENTTLTITSMDREGGSVLQVVYGRIRIKVNSIISGSSLWVTGHDTVAGVRGTDFGYDLFYDRADVGGERQTSVYVFDGEVDVYRYDSEVESKIELIDQVPLVLKSGKMVKSKSSAPTEKLKITAIND
ncbi:MAG: FecR family protein, partial [Spirochaetaceae bacterium]|nr:FecR family protein [Spirochaetaceae bacterium]